MNAGTRMTDGCHYCEGRSVRLPKGTPRERARFTPVLELHDPELAGKCIELHLHGWYGGEELIQTVRLAVDPLSREVRGQGPVGVRVVALYEKPTGWPDLDTVRGSALPGEYSPRDRLVVGAFPHFTYPVVPDQEIARGEGTLIAPVPITAMWKYSVPERR